MNQIKLGKFIASVRMERGMTQDELAEKIGVSSGKVISKWECGNTMPDFETLIEISKALKVTLYELSICKRIEDPKLIEKTKTKFRTLGQLTRVNIKNKILIITSLILGIIFGFATIFMIDNYKTIAVYRFNSSPDETKFKTTGNIFVNEEYAIFNVIKIENTEQDNQYLDINVSNIQFEIMDKNQRILFYKPIKLSSNNLKEILAETSFSMIIKRDFLTKEKDLKLIISYFDETSRKQEIIINFQIDKFFENTL